VAFSPDGKWALSGGRDDTLKLWEVPTGREVRTFSGHAGNVERVAFSPDGKWALSESEERTLMLWDVASGQVMRKFPGTDLRCHTGAFSWDGRFLLSYSAGPANSDLGAFRLWDMATGLGLRTLTLRPDAGVLSIHSWKRMEPAKIMDWLPDFSRPARYREFHARLPKARETLQKNQNDAEALRTFGEWYAFRGVRDWAVEFLEKARKGGATIDRVELARCYWELDKYPEAIREFQGELEHVKAQHVPEDPKARQQRDWDIQYFEICLDALKRAPLAK